MKIENDMLQSQMEELVCEEESSKSINSKNHEKTYNVACHKAVYCCLEYRVPITNISPVIEGVLRELAGVMVTRLPNPSTVTCCAGVLSDLQVGEIMYNCKNITLSWDLTTVNGNHINEIHISVATSPPKSYVLSLKTIAGGTTDDYMSHICESIHNIVTTYATFHSLDIDYVHTKTTIVNNLKNTLCDRVAVNHCVVQSLQDKLEV